MSNVMRSISGFLAVSNAERFSTGVFRPLLVNTRPLISDELINYLFTNPVVRNFVEGHILSSNRELSRMEFRCHLSRSSASCISKILERALFSEADQLNMNVFSTILRENPERFTDAMLERAIFPSQGEPRIDIFCEVVRSLPTRWTAHMLERALEAYSEHNAFYFDFLPFVERNDAAADTLNAWHSRRLSRFDGRMISSFPDHVLPRLDARVFNGLSEADKAKLSMRVLAKISDKAFKGLDDSVLLNKGLMAAFEADPSAYSNMPEERKIRISQLRMGAGQEDLIRSPA